MTEAQKEYESVDWHGEHLRIDQDKRGYVSISHPPFETCFNPEEMQEIAQFINKYHPVSAKSDAVLEELRTLKQYDHIKFYPSKGCLPNTRQIAKISGFSKDGKRVGIEYQQSCNIGVQMSIPISDVRAVCKWIELRQQKEREQ